MWNRSSSLSSFQPPFEIGDCSAKHPSNLDLRCNLLAREGAVWQAGYPPDPICRRETAVAVSASVVVSATLPADEGSPIFFVERAATAVTGWAVKPWALALLTTERPFHFQLDDLCMAIERDGDF